MSIEKNRREFLKQFGISVPLSLSSGVMLDYFFNNEVQRQDRVELVSDSLFLSPKEFLQQLNSIETIRGDMYGSGGSVQEIQEEFKKLTGKEAAIYLPTGTMANQMAINILSGSNTKVLVQEDSHVFRDEADAAQSVYGKRLVPIASGTSGITLNDITTTLSALDAGEVFKSGVGVISIESPVRRRDGQFVPYSELEKISQYCRKNGLKLHLDGARIHWSEVYEKHSIKEYSRLADTIYISLYKCVGSLGGAILCGSKDIIEKIPHLIKIHGGTIFQNWMYSSVALDNMRSLGDELQQVGQRSEKLIADMVKTKEFDLVKRVNGTNIFIIKPNGDANKLQKNLSSRESIFLRQPSTDGTLSLHMNKSILNRSNDELLKSFLDSL